MIEFLLYALISVAALGVAFTFVWKFVDIVLRKQPTDSKCEAWFARFLALLCATTAILGLLQSQVWVPSKAEGLVSIGKNEKPALYWFLITVYFALPAALVVFRCKKVTAT